MSAQSRASRRIGRELGRNILQFAHSLLRRIFSGLTDLIARFAPGTRRATLPLLRLISDIGIAPLRAALRTHQTIISPPAGHPFFAELSATAPLA